MSERLNVKNIGQLIEYLQAHDPEKRASCTLYDTAKTLIVVDAEGNASVHKVDRKRELIILIDLPVTNS